MVRLWIPQSKTDQLRNEIKWSLQYQAGHLPSELVGEVYADGENIQKESKPFLFSKRQREVNISGSFLHYPKRTVQDKDVALRLPSRQFWDSQSEGRRCISSS